MGYIYSALWFITAFVLILRFRKESIVIYILSAYFVFAGVWWCADELSVIDMMVGTYAWILRIVSAVMLLLTAVVYLIEKNVRAKKAANTAANGADQETRSADNL